MHWRIRLKSIAWVTAVLLFGGGCDMPSASDGTLQAIWARRGTADGRLQKPRAMAIDDKDRVYIVDMSARIQVFDTDGVLLHPPWRMPDYQNGKPTGVSIDREGNLMVADTHYYRILFFAPDGTPLPDRTLGGTAGQGPGEFGLVTDVVQDSAGNYYVSEYGDFDRIQKFSPEGTYLLQWGGHGEEPGQFRRPQNMVIDRDDRIWVADACNHRIQVFDTDGNRLACWGTHGAEPGQLGYPYDLAVDEEYVYVCEYGNNRIQQFKHDGTSVACWGHAGRGPGELHNPWALVRDHAGDILVLDTNNHRVQRVRL